MLIATCGIILFPVWLNTRQLYGHCTEVACICTLSAFYHMAKHHSSKISATVHAKAQNLLYFLPENPNIFYFLEFFKSYIFVEVDFDHWVYPQLSPSLSFLHSILPRKLAIQKQVGTGCLKKNFTLAISIISPATNMLKGLDVFLLKVGLYRSVWSTKRCLYNIRKSRYK